MNSLGIKPTGDDMIIASKLHSSAKAAGIEWAMDAATRVMHAYSCHYRTTPEAIKLVRDTWDELGLEG